MAPCTPPSSKDEFISKHEKTICSTPRKSASSQSTPMKSGSSSRKLSASTPSKSPSILLRPLTPLKAWPPISAFAPSTPTPTPVGRSPAIVFSSSTPRGSRLTIPSPSPSTPTPLGSLSSNSPSNTLSFTSSSSWLSQFETDYKFLQDTNRHTPTRRNSNSTSANAPSPVEVVSNMRTMTLRVSLRQGQEQEPENENDDGMGYGITFPDLTVEVESEPESEPESESERPETPHKETNVEGSQYAVSCRKGRKGKKKSMEDTHKVMTMTINVVDDSSNSNSGSGSEQEFDAEDVLFFGVFDGHGGRAAADFAAQNIGKNIGGALLRAMEDAEIEDSIINKSNLLDKKNLEQAVRAGYLRTDQEFVEQGVSSGTTCVTALIVGGKLVVSNAGDSRAVISRGAGVAEALTRDHKAGMQDEQDRIEKLGGLVLKCGGCPRIGRLVVSRRIGDSDYKEWVTPEPDTTIIEITSHDEFLILATDGLWDVVSNQEAVDVARPFCVGLSSGGPLAATEKLVELAVARKSTDDITVMIIQLQHFSQQYNPPSATCDDTQIQGLELIW